MPPKRELFGIEELRNAVRYFSVQNETFNQRYSADELVRLWRYAASPEAKGLDECADRWTAEEIETALSLPFLGCDWCGAIAGDGRHFAGCEEAGDEPIAPARGHDMVPPLGLSVTTTTLPSHGYTQPPAVVFTGAKPYAPPTLRKIEPTKALRAAFSEPSDAEVRAELLRLSRDIVREHDRAEALLKAVWSPPGDAQGAQIGEAVQAMALVHDAAVQCTIALKDYLEALETKESR